MNNARPTGAQRGVGFPAHFALMGTFALLAAGSLPITSLRATPPGDPICGPSSSLAPVLATRARLVVETKSARPRIGLQQLAERPALAIDQEAFSGRPRLLLSGQAGRVGELEATMDPGSGNWQPWLSLVLGEQSTRWTDDLFASMPARFFRLRVGEAQGLGESASNFRLLDASGISRDLYYHTHLAGLVILAAGTNLNTVTSLVPSLSALGRAHADRVEIWLLLSDPTPVRSNVLAQANALGIGFPVLLDSHDLAARSVGLTRVGDVAVVRTPDFTVSYRGTVGHASQSTAAETYLGQALASLVNGAPATFLRTPSVKPLLAHVSEETPVYSRDIAPILYRYCAPCHRPDGVAPFALTNYSVAQSLAPAIRHAVASGMMPPWHADPEFGQFTNDLSLPANLKAALVRWIDAGAPRGSGGDPLADLPVPPAFDEWPADLGEPDALVTIPVQTIKATGSEPYRYIYAQAPNPTNVWLRAAAIRPSNLKAVHHYLVWVGRIGNRSGMPDSSTYESHIAEFVPGYKPARFAENSGILLGRSNWLTFNLHYNTYGIETNDQPLLALWYHRSRPAKTWVAGNVADGNFVIPPGARDFEVQAVWSNTPAITIHRLNPHLHVRGKRMKYELVHPGGMRETLLSVPDYDFNWQIGYTLAQPKAVSAGSHIVVTGAFDNSAQNLANPDPSVPVEWGDQSWMEMFVGFIDYTR